MLRCQGFTGRPSARSCWYRLALTTRNVIETLHDRSLATFDVPMVVDLIGIYVLKGPYCTLTMNNWFLQALSVIPRGSWGDVARRFTLIRWEIYRRLPLKCQIPCESGRSQAPRRQQVWTGLGLSRSIGSAMSFWLSVNAGQYWYQIWSFGSECFGKERCEAV
ncbi:hypothetical protein F511_39146 [Dorcoceras hygrometricum]|uniref:Uncharacterized protein n=1 Tax=Dorcoceras hygrometricum TaxID=472368 RepID=A0A2Z7A8H7_9LAMI|nr:hypothetical protein F511_39146 [Dorcoceras hygrometricum]